MSVEFERKSRKKRRWGRVVEYGSYEKRYVFGNVYDDIKKKVEKNYSKAKGFTPQEVADSNDIRVSVARNILDDLEKEGKVEQVISTHRVKIYRGTSE